MNTSHVFEATLGKDITLQYFSTANIAVPAKLAPFQDNGRPLIDESVYW